MAVKFSAQTLLLISIRIGALIFKFCLYMFLAQKNGPKILGQLGVLTSVVILFSAAGDLCLFQNIARDSVTDSFNRTLKHVRQYIKTLPVQFLFVTLVCYIIAVNQVSTMVLVVGAVLVFTETMNNNVFALLLNQNKTLCAQIHYFIRAALWIPILYLLYSNNLMKLTLESVLVLWCLASSIAVLMGIYNSKIFKAIHCKEDEAFYKWLKKRLKGSIQLAKMNGLTALNDNVTSFLLSFALGLELFGIFVYFQQVASALMNVIRFGMIQPLWHKLIIEFELKNESPVFLFKKYLSFIVLVSLTGIIFVYPGYYFLTQYLNNDQFLPYFSLFLPILLLFLFSVCGCLQDAIFYSIRQETELNRFLSVQLPLNFAVIFVASKVLGLYGVAWGMALVALVLYFAKYNKLISLSKT